MKNRLIPLVDQLKNICNIDHTQHRSYINFLVNMVAGLIRYTYFEKKPSINFSQNDRDLLFKAIEKNTPNANFKGFALLQVLSNSG